MRNNLNRTSKPMAKFTRKIPMKPKTASYRLHYDWSARSSSLIDLCAISDLHLLSTVLSLCKLHKEKNVSGKMFIEIKLYTLHMCVASKNTFRFSRLRSFFSLSTEKRWWKKDSNSRFLLSKRRKKKRSGKRKHIFGVGFVVSLLKNRAQKISFKTTTTAHNMPPLRNLFHNHYTRRLQMCFQTFFLLFLARSLRVCIKE